MHAVVNQTFPPLLRRFWVMRDSRPFCSLINELPLEMLEPTFPFHQVGLDFAEPLHVRDENQAIKKVYICLFTCMVTNVVHLELVTDMTTTCFLTFKQADSFVPALLVRESSGKLLEELDRNALRKVLGTSLLRSDELQTILCKLEARINDRLLALLSKTP
ncbi:hypothetical protein T08_10117 [Trichinella sp. T8]|nr:hypothetical protein T08_10117 [Trichinella sp. T8]